MHVAHAAHTCVACVAGVRACMCDRTGTRVRLGLGCLGSALGSASGESGLGFGSEGGVGEEGTAFVWAGEGGYVGSDQVQWGQWGQWGASQQRLAAR